MNSIKKIILVLVGIVLIGSTSLDFATCSIPCGWYIDANIGGSRLSNTNFGSGTSFSNGNGAINLNGGYKFTPFFATEVGYIRFANTKITLASFNLATLTEYAWDVAAKGILPICDTSFELFAKLGAARLTSKISESSDAAALGFTFTKTHTSNAYFIGAGANYILAPHMPIIFQWLRARGDNNTSGTVDFYSIGIGYYFS